MKIILHEKKTIQGGIPGLAVMERGIYSEGDEFKSRPYSFYFKNARRRHSKAQRPKYTKRSETNAVVPRGRSWCLVL